MKWNKWYIYISKVIQPIDLYFVAFILATFQAAHNPEKIEDI